MPNKGKLSRKENEGNHCKEIAVCQVGQSNWELLESGWRREEMAKNTTRPFFPLETGSNSMATGNKHLWIESSFSALLASEIPWEPQAPVWETPCWTHLTVGLCLLCFCWFFYWNSTLNYPQAHKPFSFHGVKHCFPDLSLTVMGWAVLFPLYGSSVTLCFRLNPLEQDSFPF